MGLIDVQCDHFIHNRCNQIAITGSCVGCAMKYRKADEAPEAKWKHRAEHNDFIWAECSNCGFREEAWKVVYKGKSDREYIDVKWKYCPMCGKRMGV